MRWKEDIKKKDDALGMRCVSLEGDRIGRRSGANIKRCVDWFSPCSSPTDAAKRKTSRTVLNRSGLVGCIEWNAGSVRTLVIRVD